MKLRHTSRLLVMQGAGVVSPPAFIYELNKGAIYRRARIKGLQRYGRAPKSGDDDTRPLALSYYLTYAGDFNTPGYWQGPNNTSITLTNVPAPFDGRGPGLNWAGVDAQAYATTRNNGFQVVQNGAFNVRARLTTPPKGKPRIWFVRVGAAGAGFLFQIRNGKPEVAFLSADWTLAKENALRVLWEIDEPSESQETDIETKVEEIYNGFESLTFERGMGRDSESWYNSTFSLTFIPEPCGRVHIVLEGRDATAAENPDIIATRKEGILWGAGSVTVGSQAGATLFQLGRVVFRSQGMAEYGPFTNGFIADQAGELTYKVNGSLAGGSITFEQVAAFKVKNVVKGFGFKATLLRGHVSTTPWVYGLRARLNNGPLNGSSDPNFDTSDLYQPINGKGEKGNPIEDIEVQLDEKNGRSLHITMRDVEGRLNLTDYDLDNRVASAWIDGNPAITRALVVETKRLDLANAKANVAPIQQKRKTSKITVTLRDGMQLLEETKCRRAPVGDGEFLSDHIRAVLLSAGFAGWQIAGIPVGAGRRLPAAALGEEWAILGDGDSSCADYIRHLLDHYGYGLFFYQTRAGVWTLREQDTTIKAAFSAVGGRYRVLRPLDFISNYSDFYNFFEVIGGVDGELVAEDTIWESINQVGIHWRPYWIGRLKAYETLRNPALRTLSDVNWALHSLKWRYFRPGRRAQFETYFHDWLMIGDRITIDGREFEIEGISGASMRADKMQMLVREIPNA